jgi:hypothetical protein
VTSGLGQYRKFSSLAKMSAFRCEPVVIGGKADISAHLSAARENRKDFWQPTQRRPRAVHRGRKEQRGGVCGYSIVWGMGTSYLCCAEPSREQDGNIDF